jgi:hypothetical protein
MYIKGWFEPIFSLFLHWLLSKLLNTNGQFCPKLRLWLPLPPALVVTLTSLSSTSYLPIDNVELSTLYNNQQYSTLCTVAASFAFKEGNTVAWRSHTGEEASRLLIRVNVKLSWCVIKHHATKANFRVKVQIPRVSIRWRRLVNVASLPLHPGRKITSSSHRVEGWVHRREGLVALENRKVSWPCPESNWGSSLVGTVHLLNEHRIRP